jgi:hypothetical protein
VLKAVTRRNHSGVARVTGVTVDGVAAWRLDSGLLVPMMLVWPVWSSSHAGSYSPWWLRRRS